MNDRHAIMSDKDFWHKLEFKLSGFLEDTDVDEFRGYWCDGFNPETLTNTKRGVDIRGRAWIAKDSRSMSEFDFLISIPQKLLHKKIQEYDIDLICSDIGRAYLELNILPFTKSLKNIRSNVIGNHD